MSSIFFRAFEADDYLLINKWRNDPEIQKLTGGTFRYVSSEREKEWVKDKIMNNTSDIYLAICLNDKPMGMIGYVSINDIDHIHRSAKWGGIVIDSSLYDCNPVVILIDTCICLFNYVFMELNINRFYGLCLEEHENSKKMMTMMNMSYEGKFRKSIYKHGKYHNQLIFSILQEDYFEMNKDARFDYKNLLKNMVKKY